MKPASTVIVALRLLNSIHPNIRELVAIDTYMHVYRNTDIRTCMHKYNREKDLYSYLMGKRIPN